jgi:hypothetical protein
MASILHFFEKKYDKPVDRSLNVYIMADFPEAFMGMNEEGVDEVE